MANTSKDLEGCLNRAFATSNLRRICLAVDTAVLQSGGVVDVARAAEIDRTTLYRAFRLAGGPGLDTMIKVLRALGLRLVVEVGQEIRNDYANSESLKAHPANVRQAVATARRFTAAINNRETGALLTVFAETVRAQENVAEFAVRTTTTREHLYRVFSKNLNPRFSTLLSFLNALGLRFAVRRLPQRLRSGKVVTGNPPNGALAE